MKNPTKEIVAAFKICTPSYLPLIERNYIIANKIRLVCKLSNVDLGMIEDQHFERNPNTLKYLSKLAGAIEFSLMQDNIVLFSEPPSRIRMLLDSDSGGAADKEEVCNFIREYYKDTYLINKLGEFDDNARYSKNSDIYDAISIAFALVNLINGHE